MPTDAAETARREPETNIILHWIGCFCLWVMGWQIVGHVPDVPRLVIAGGPHTSNMDGFMLIFAAWTERIKIVWLAKRELFVGPLGWLFSALGAIPVDRSASRNAVDQVVREFNRREKMILVIAPEGTRKKSDHWKTGFYWIAASAGVPILLGTIDYARKEIDLSAPLLMPSGDIEADMKQVWDVYQDVQGRYPENMNDLSLRSAAQNHQNGPTQAASSEA